PSATSNGAGLVSATPETKYTTSSGNSHSQFHEPTPPACVATILPRFMLPVAISTPTRAKPMAISYATICAAERMAPRKAYLELAAQPAMMTPYTPMEVSDSRYRRPASAFDTTTVGDSGITAQAANAGTSVITGASQNSALLDFAGMTTSFRSSLNTSANGWPTPGSSPKMRTRFGPRRSCIQPITLRSQSVSSATQMMSATVITRIHTVDCPYCGKEAQAVLSLSSTSAPRP